MGGCATKPKVSKGDEGEIPVPSEEVPEANEAEVKAAKDIDATYGNIDDDQSNKRPSLSNLFEEREHKGTAESAKTQSEAEPMEKETLESSMPQESPEPVTKEPEKPVSVPPGNIESGQSNEAKPAPEAAAVDVLETSAGETKDETLVGK